MEEWKSNTPYFPIRFPSFSSSLLPSPSPRKSYLHGLIPIPPIRLIKAINLASLRNSNVGVRQNELSYMCIIREAIHPIPQGKHQVTRRAVEAVPRSLRMERERGRV